MPGYGLPSGRSQTAVVIWGTLAVYVGLKALFPEEGEQLYLLFRFVRYALLGLWIGLGAPLVFRLLRLVESDWTESGPAR